MINGNTFLYLSAFIYTTDNLGCFSKIAGYQFRRKTSATENGLKISIPATAPDSIATVIRLEVKGGKK